jgi:hypothetical protein
MKFVLPLCRELTRRAERLRIGDECGCRTAADIGAEGGWNERGREEQATEQDTDK